MPEDVPALKEMYDNFSPKAVTQGLPPATQKTRDKWVEGLIEAGHNFVAWHDGKVIGHSALIVEEDRNNGEYLIFVLQNVRNKGLGTLLTKRAIDKARELGLAAVWLTVEALNFRAIKLYKKEGFVFQDTGERERTMILRL